MPTTSCPSPSTCSSCACGSPRCSAFARSRATSRRVAGRSRGWPRSTTSPASPIAAASTRTSPQQLAHARDSGGRVALLMLDIDHFKRVNDSLGHTAGDALLAFFGRLMIDVVRTGDACYRYGGEEFAIVADGAGIDAAVEIGERVRHAFALQSTGATPAGARTVSVGVSATDQFESPPTPSQMIEAADAALYRAKTLGRNCVARHDTRQLVRVA
ncbi:MAG: GGDEF domain-containing protein [Deltaproteobacteria bacterium]|nr:GGDEF domain-containing protein [Deltaproteobacteria bacterium]